jgi:hypothetical protein
MKRLDLAGESSEIARGPIAGRGAHSGTHHAVGHDGVKEGASDGEYASLGNPEVSKLSLGWCWTTFAEVRAVERGGGIRDQPGQRWIDRELLPVRRDPAKTNLSCVQHRRNQSRHDGKEPLTAPPRIWQN